MRILAVAATTLALALAGCMHMGDGDDWDAYDSGRGLGFGVILTILLVVGGVMLVTNLAGATRPAAPPPPAPAPPVPPSPEPEAMGWEPVRPAAPARTKPAGRTAAPKPAKPRRPSP